MQNYCFACLFVCSAGTFAVISLMIGSVAVREAPDSMFTILPANGSNMSAVLDVEARDARRVQVAVVLTTLVGIIQVSLKTTATLRQQLKAAIEMVYLPSAPTECLVIW